MGTWRPILSLCLALVVAAAAAQAQAGSLKISPLQLALSPTAPIATLLLQNLGAQPLIVDIGVAAWSQDGGRDRFEDTREVLVIPPVFELEPGAEQLVRVGTPAPVPAQAQEQAFRLFIQEIKPAAPAAAGRVPLPLRLSLPLFMPPVAPAAPGRLEASVVADVDRRELRLANRGPAHVKVTGIEVQAADGAVLARQGLVRYVLPGQVQRLAGPLPAAAGRAVIAYRRGGVLDRLVVPLGGPSRAPAAG
jgi:fimbrial chaperone protein